MILKANIAVKHRLNICPIEDIVDVGAKEEADM